MYRQITLLSVLICFLAAPALAAQMSVEPVYQEVFQGDNITVDIVVYPDGSEVYGANYALYFNNTLLNATSQEKGPFLTHDGESSSIYKDEINNSIGKIIYAESRSGTTVGVTDPGVLTTITFQVIGEEGVSSLDLGELEGLLLCSPSGFPISTTLNNGSVEVRKGICGDVDGIPGVTMNDGRQIFMNIIYGSAQYPINDSWAADCDGLCDGITMNDGRQIFMNIIYGSAQYPLGCC